jgi:hypothetical protein
MDAHLERALFWETNLEHANLKEAHLDGADLRGANLKDAGLQGASLLGADLTGADFSGAIVCGAVVSDSALRDTGVAALFASAKGRDRLATPSMIAIANPRVAPNSDAPPAELTRGDRAAYSKWHRAGLAVEQLRQVVPTTVRPNSVVDRRALLRMLNAIDVSMGQGTQRLKLRLVQTLERPTTRGIRFSDIAPQYREFEARVWEKLRNHCVPLVP